MRVLIISLSTYSGPYNDGKLEQLGLRLGSVTAVAGDFETIWGKNNQARSGFGYEVHILPLRFTRSVATARLVGLQRIVDAARPTIVHIECEPWQAVAVQSLRLAQRLRVPVGVHLAETGPLLTGVGGAMRRARGSWVLKRCDYAVGWTGASAMVAQRLAPGIRTDTVPGTGVSMTMGAAGSPDHWFGMGSAALPKLAFVGRFAIEKGICEFLEVCDEIARRHPLRAAIAGGQGMDETVRRWAEERPWANFHGVLPRTEVGSLLAAADALVCPSRTTSIWEEQFGKGAIEAMAVGTPVFAYDSGALAEVIGTGGIVVPEGAQDRLVEELERYLTRPAIDRGASEQLARCQAARFSNEILAESLIRLWSACGRSLDGED